LYSDYWLNIGNYTFNGNIIVFSTDSVNIQRENALVNAIIVAPKVRIDSLFKGSIQIIATDSVIIERGCKLEYPSSIIMFPQINKIDNNGCIQIQQNAEINGCVALIDNSEGKSKSKVSLLKDSKIIGQLYCNANTDIKSSVIGSTYASRFIIETSRAYYENHLMDVTISGTDISKYFIFSEIIPFYKKEIIKWVN
jgi:hypothetical protein